MRKQNGLTLPELLISFTILSLVISMSAPPLGRFMDDQASVARANTVVGLLRQARASAAALGPVLVCAEGSDCQSFDGPARGLKLVHDSNNNRRHDDGDTVLDRIQLADNESVHWRSFRMKPWLRYGHRGVSWYQNGHFLLCHDKAARKVVVSTQGRGRVEPAGETTRRRCQ